MAEDQESPKIHVDTDWKAQAQREKEKLAAKDKPTASPSGAAPEGGKQTAKGAEGSSEAAPGGGGSSGGEMPPATFETLLSTMATQALFAMGAIADPRTGQRTAHLDLAKHHIDMLGVLEDKTKGNLSDEESELLSATLHELRTHYVQITSSASQGGGDVTGGGGGAAKADSVPPPNL